MAGREETSGQARWAEELLGRLRPAGDDLDGVVGWLADAVDATVSLRDGAGEPLAGAPAELDEALVRDLATGRIAAAAYQDGGRHLRLVRVDSGGPGPAAVLAVARTAPFDRPAAGIVTNTAQVMALLLAARASAEAGYRLERATADLRLAILQLLMVEEIVSARRVAAGFWPGLLDTDTASVYVVETEPAARDRLARECRDETREGALVVRCPAMDGHVIVVAPGESTGDELRTLVGRHPGTLLGGSVRQSLVRTATAYTQAVSALAVARIRPGRAAVYAERTRPELLMDHASLHAWAAHVLRPLDSLPHHTRAELLATTRLGLGFTAVSAAKVLGVSRNTVRARMDRVESLLGTDFDDLTVRATVHVALNAEAGSAVHPGEERPGTDRVRLTDLLAGTALRTWAEELLARLDRDSRDLRRTLRTWIAVGANAERTARELGLHPQTVRDHIRSAEPAVERRLLDGGADLYEIVLAFLAAGELDRPALRGTTRDDPDSPVHG
ncbi:helix-turn-helix domain-containing protein [Streptomyces sp. CRN 30]|uniref:helix-turn-helix domain-containing protein n=1 Tax=Streptomyces sp. CRN 30 TaxID=3075613 RepID=UPI002A82E616|nr:helix-turn-helix domain-containing protein [Streptomyces sp. CRN 30]